MGRKHSKGKAAKNARKNQMSHEEELAKMPHSIVIPWGKKVGKGAQRLLQDFRKVMEPFTASNIKVVRRRNRIWDFVTNAGVLNVTNIILFTQTSKGIYFRVARTPQGPTLTFKILNYALNSDIVSAQRRPVAFPTMHLNSPLAVFSNFKKETPKEQVVDNMFHNLFPDVDGRNLNSIRRMVFLNYNEEDDTFSFSHYTTKIIPTSISKPFKKIIKKKVPDLSRFKDMEDYIENAGLLSESEIEEGQNSKFELPQPINSRGVLEGEEVSAKLAELGPRMILQLIKVESGCFKGEVLYHRYIQKTKKEIEKLRSVKRTPKLTPGKYRKQKEDKEVKKIEQEKKKEDVAPPRAVKRKHSYNDENEPPAKICKNALPLKRFKRFKLSKQNKKNKNLRTNKQLNT
ncbi:PPAN [Cordylochernes scorpioides]|uniref:PPAN n=1 Tax=Cordylochernes scorpioides TaxID=51811 RepID=A0ABY6KUU5_9ARAC|nr:PPAN [Cordylochernes scorpioides]